MAHMTGEAWLLGQKNPSKLFCHSWKLTMPDIAFFCPELFDFLRQLKLHNNRNWFAKNKARYEKMVLDPALLCSVASLKTIPLMT